MTTWYGRWARPGRGPTDRAVGRARPAVALYPRPHGQRPSGGYSREGKSDATYALVIADQARMRRDLQVLRPRDEATVELGVLTARQADVVADRARSVAPAAALLTGNRDPIRIVIGVVVVVVIATGVVGGVTYEHSRSTATTTAQTAISALTVAGSDKYPASVDRANATVSGGSADGECHVNAH